MINELSFIDDECLKLLQAREDIDLTTLNSTSTDYVRKHFLISTLATRGIKSTTTVVDGKYTDNEYFIYIHEVPICYTIRFKYSYLADATGWLDRENNSITKIPIGIKNIYFEV